MAHITGGGLPENLGRMFLKRGLGCSLKIPYWQNDVVQKVLAHADQRDPNVVAYLHAKLHLDDPFPIRYYYWITGVLHGACGEAGMPSASLWASVPHYVAAAPNPKAALALVRRLEMLVGVTVDAGELETAAADYERQVSLAVQSDPDVQAFVERLEHAADEDDTDLDPTDLPSGDVIAREFQRFLRQRGPGGEGPTFPPPDK